MVIIGNFSDNNENPEAPLPRETIPLEQDLEQLETQLREVNANQEQLNKNFLELTEVKFLFSISVVKGTLVSEFWIWYLWFLVYTAMDMTYME